MARHTIILHSEWLESRAGAFSREHDVIVCPGRIVPELVAGKPAARALVTSGSNDLPGSELSLLPELRLIACLGDGYNGIDLDYCRANGIVVTNGHHANHEDVADLALGLMIAVLRGFGQGHAHVMSDAWRTRGRLPAGHSLRHYKVGIVGMGAIGQSVAEKIAPLGMETSWWGPREKPGVGWPRAPDLITLAQTVDVLVVACVGLAETRHLISAPVIDALGPGGYIVNVSRGFVIDEPAMVRALKDGRLAGAGLDVFDPEPPFAEHWRDVPNVVAMPHMGGATIEADQRQLAIALDNLARFFGGAALVNVVA